jgi:hypothetical protein
MSPSGQAGSRRLLARVLIAFAVGLLLVASFTFGVQSARLQTRPARVARFLIEQGGVLFSRRPADKKGIWHKARDAAGTPLSKEQEDALAKLPALPYLQGYAKAPALSSVTIHDEQRAQDGLNFVVSADSARAFLMDMKGNVLHTWRKPFAEVWPERAGQRTAQDVYKSYWRRAELLPSGELLAIFMTYGVIKLDKDSNLLWAYDGRAHHDLFVDERGQIHVLTGERRKRGDLRIESWSSQQPVWEDAISVLSPEGKELRRFSVLEAFLKSNHAPLLEHMKGPTDILHANTIRPVPDDRHPIFRKGQVLLSLREIHALAAVDLRQEKVTWAATGMWKYQHEPRLLESGNLLLFDNRGNDGMSRALEFNPMTQEVVWSYQGDPPEAFQSREAGTLERLANGNTLITESEKGRGFEVTPGGEIVWEFINPHRAGERNELIAALYDVVRVDRAQCAWLAQDARPGAP